MKKLKWLLNFRSIGFLCLLFSTSISGFYFISTHSLADYDAIDPVIVDHAIFTNAEKTNAYVGHISATTNQIEYRMGEVCKLSTATAEQLQACELFAHRVKEIEGSFDSLYERRCTNANRPDGRSICQELLTATSWVHQLDTLIALGLITFAGCVLCYWILPRFRIYSQKIATLFGAMSCCLYVSFAVIVIDTTSLVEYLLNLAIPANYPYIFVVQGVGVKLLWSLLFIAGSGATTLLMIFANNAIRVPNASKIVHPTTQFKNQQ